MRNWYLSATLLVGLVVAQTATAVVYEGIDFALGDASFADGVIGFHPDFSGGNVPTDPRFVNPSRAVGPPDFVPDNGTGAVALGSGGRLEVLFADNVLTNGAGADLAVFERAVDESFHVAVRPANPGTRARLVSIGRCPTTGFCSLVGARTPMGEIALVDLDTEFAGFGPGDLRFDAVQLTDDPGQGANSGDQVGADIDAVGAIVSAGIVCGDGLLEGGETCDDGGVADGDGCASTCHTETCWVCQADVEPSLCTVNVGGPCEDGEPCTTGDICGGPMGVTCIGGPAPNCSDGNPCTDDSCVNGIGCTSAPNTASCDDGSSCSVGDHCAGGTCVGAAVERTNCHLSIGTTQLRIWNRLDNDSDAVTWLWPTGEATTFDDPSQGPGSYELCVFDGPPAGRRLRVAARADKGHACGSATCWRPKGRTGYLFKSSAAPFGMSQLLLKSGAHGKAKVLAKGRGPALHLSDGATMTLPVRAELRDTSTSECWADAYSDAIRNDEDRFKAKH